MTDPPITRWARSGERRFGYADRFAELIATGADVDGEARLADVLLPRAGRVLDAGAGMGRVGAALLRRGHTVVAAEPDPDMLALARDRYPELDARPLDVLDLATEPDLGRFDLVVCVGNVMILLAEDTEQRALRSMASVLGPEGRLLVGFHQLGGPAHGRRYSFDQFAEDVADAGLRVQARFGGYRLEPPGEEYVVAVLIPAPSPDASA